MNVEVGLNLKTRQLGTVVGTPQTHIIPFSSMSENQRRAVMGQLVPIDLKTIEYLFANRTTNRCRQFFEVYDGCAKGKIPFNPLHLAELRDEVEFERRWRL